MDWSGWMTGDPPCWASNDHQWRGGSCRECGERFRCICGRFLKVEDIDAHAEECPTLVRLDRQPAAPDAEKEKP